MYIRETRKTNETRKISFIRNPMPNSFSSVEVNFGSTRVFCTASISSSVPSFAADSGRGWLNAEYNMLPGSTNTRKKRDGVKADGRGVEISRLIGRSLRSAINLENLSGYAITIDCDVIVADGGTRTASITGAFCALSLAIDKMLEKGFISENPILFPLASISAGKVAGVVMVDLDYVEDSQADVDCNVVMNGNGDFIEIQGAGEKGVLKKNELLTMLDYSEQALNSVFKLQKDFLAK